MRTFYFQIVKLYKKCIDDYNGDVIKVPNNAVQFIGLQTGKFNEPIFVL